GVVAVAAGGLHAIGARAPGDRLYRSDSTGWTDGDGSQAAAGSCVAGGASASSAAIGRGLGSRKCRAGAVDRVVTRAITTIMANRVGEMTPRSSPMLRTISS